MIKSVSDGGVILFKAEEEPRKNRGGGPDGRTIKAAEITDNKTPDGSYLTLPFEYYQKDADFVLNFPRKYGPFWALRIRYLDIFRELRRLMVIVDDQKKYIKELEEIIEEMDRKNG